MSPFVRDSAETLSRCEIEEIRLVGTLLTAGVHKRNNRPLVFADIEVNSAVHTVNVPLASGMVRDVFRLRGRRVKAVIEKVRSNGESRKRLLFIERDTRPFNPFLQFAVPAARAGNLPK